MVDCVLIFPQSLDISHNKLLDFGGITEFCALKTLHLGSNNIEDLPVVFSNLTGLTELFLESNGINNVPTMLLSRLT